MTCIAAVFAPFPGADAASSSARHASVSRVSRVVGPDPAAPFASRLRVVHSLSRNLSQADVQSLYAFLDRGNDDDPLPPNKLNALKNDVANALLRQKRTPRQFGPRLAAMHNDPEHDRVWRDYCIQFMPGCYFRGASPAERELIEETLWKAAGKDWSIAGTALISLRRLGDSIDQEKVARRGLEIATDEEAGEAARITALQVCANAGLREVLPAARQIVVSEKPVPLRISAIGAVGLLGNFSDNEILGKYEYSSDTRLRTACRAAIKRINSRRN